MHGVQYTFGHALGNTLLPLFLAITNHIALEDLSTNLQVLFAALQWEGDVLPALARATISDTVELLPQWLQDKQQDRLAGVWSRYAHC